MNRVNTIKKNANQVKQTEQYLKSQYHDGKSPIHELYVSRFNAVDLGDRYYAKVNDGHRIMDWHSKMLYAILKLGNVNVYVRFLTEQHCDWIDFRRNLGKQLIKYE